jgi:hypothetical protein
LGEGGGNIFLRNGESGKSFRAFEGGISVGKTVLQENPDSISPLFAQ